MSVTDDDQFAAYGGANYDYLAMGPIAASAAADAAKAVTRYGAVGGRGAAATKSAVPSYVIGTQQ